MTWKEARAYVQLGTQVPLNEGDLPPGGAGGMTLPSEAQWEYAARGPEGRRYPWGDDPPSPDLANYGESGIGRTTPVGQYPEGASWVGALDMAGNVWEWCEDAWHESYQGAPDDGGAWITDNKDALRVVRGGGWVNVADWVRSAYRLRRLVGYRYRFRGFRVLLAAPPRRSPVDP